MRMMILAAALLAMAPAAAQTPPRVGTASVAPTSAIGYGPVNGPFTAVTPSTPLPTTSTNAAPATSTPLAGSVTPSTATPTSGAATISGGVARIGPLAPNLGRAVRVTLSGTWTGSFALGTSSDGCATVAPLTVAGTQWGVFSGNANEAVDTASADGISYCATAAVASGTLAYRVSQ